MSAIRVIELVVLLVLGGAVSAGAQPSPTQAGSDYLIGTGDLLQVFVWKNPELSTEVPVRPDGKITTPLVQDIQAQGRTTTELAAQIRESLGRYIQDPVVTVLVKSFAAPSNSAAIRVIGAAATPKTVPYHAGLTALDVMIEVGGLNVYASGNHSILIRYENGAYHSYHLRLADLINAGDLSANKVLMPGDVIRVPERWF